MPEERLGKTVDLRSKCPHFRVLVIGRANAGKTTLLKKVCNSIEDPEVFDEDGKKVDLKTVEGYRRGIHDIDKQLVFKNNQRFIFHDSEGFESGSKDEVTKVQNFIAKRAAANSLSAQLHVIWYCVPTDNHRPLLNFDHLFFNTDLAGKVPVIAVFTKFDGLLTQAFVDLKGEGMPRKEALEARHHRAEQKLENDFIKHLKAAQYPPSGYVRLDDMRKSDSTCNDLIESTAAALTDETLRLLFVSVQQNNIDLCIKYAMKHGLNSSRHHMALISLAYFPHVWRDEEYDELPNHHDPPKDNVFDNNANECAKALNSKFLYLSEESTSEKSTSEESTSASTEESTEPKPPIPSRPGVSCEVVILTAICICAEYTFTVASAKGPTFAAAFLMALDAYLTSLHATVMDRIAQLVPSGGTEAESKQEGQGWGGEKVAALTDIVKKHRLRSIP